MNVARHTTADTPRRRGRGGIGRIAACIIGLTLVAAACSDSGGDASTSDTTSATTAAAAATTAPPTSAADTVGAADEAAEDPADDGRASDTGRGLAGLDSLSPADIGRDIVFTAQITVVVHDVALAGQAALDALAPLGGLLFGQQTTTDPVPRTVLILKVLPDDFQEALARLGGIGELRSQQVSADDVTDRIVDLESRIITSETSVERLRLLLGGAVGLDEIAALERELLDREQSLEQLRGQLRTIEDAVGLATITVTIEQIVPPVPRPAIEAQTTFYVGDDAGSGCPAGDATRINEAEVVTMCIEVTNTGDRPVSQITITDRELRIEHEQLILLSDPSDPLLGVGESWLYATTFTATTSLSTETRVSARPYEVINDGAVEMTGPGLSTVVFAGVFVIADDSLPGFGDAFNAAGDVLLVIIGILVIMAGVIIPFLWVPVLIAGAFWIRRKLLSRRGTSSTPKTNVAQGSGTIDQTG